MARTPIAVNLTCCEKIIIEEGTRNITLVNCFVRREAKAFPADSISFVVFAILTDGEGETPVEVVVSTVDGAEIVHREQRNISFAGPLKEIGVRFLVRDCVFPVAGYYEVLLFANRELTANRKIHLLQRS